VPQHDRAAAIFALRDRPLEGAIVERMVLGTHGKAVFARIEARALGHRPALEHAVELQPKVPVKPGGVVLLDDKAVAAFSLGHLKLAPARLLRLREVALAVVGLNVERHAPGHSYALLRAGAFAGSFLLELFLADAFLGFSSLPRFSSPRLFLSAAMRSMAFEPLGGPASASGSSMIFSPFFFCFSSIRRWRAST